MISSLAAAGMGGALLAFSFGPNGFPPAAWVALLPLFWSLERASTISWATVCGFVFGLAFFLLDVRWICPTLWIHGHFSLPLAIILYVCMSAALSLCPAAFALSARYLSDRGISMAVAAPLLWALSEYVRAEALTGFPWDLLGYSQMGQSALVQVLDVTGVYGVSFVVALGNATLWEVFRSIRRSGRFPARQVFFAGAVGVLVLCYGLIQLSRFPVTEKKADDHYVGVLQGNIPQEVKWSDKAREWTFFTYEKLGAKAVKAGSELLIWPETSVPVLFGSRDSDWKEALRISTVLNVPMIVGAPSMAPGGRTSSFRNSAFLVNGSKVLAQYDKIHLVPFGEYMPLTWLLPLGPGIAAREDDYSPGEQMTVMRVGSFPPLSVLICYEAIFPSLAREALNNGARLLVNITNDGWFGGTDAPYQHLEMARARSIENRVWMVRCANTGASAAFDRAGRIVKSIPMDKEGYFVVRIPRSPKAGSFYTRFGDVFVWVCFGLLGACVLRPRMWSHREGDR